MGYYTGLVVLNAKIQKRYQPLVKFLEYSFEGEDGGSVHHSWKEAYEIFGYGFLEDLAKDERSIFVPGRHVEGCNGDWIKSQNVEPGFRGNSWSLYCDLKNYDDTIEKFVDVLRVITSYFQINQGADPSNYTKDVDFIRIHTEDQGMDECTEIEL